MVSVMLGSKGEGRCAFEQSKPEGKGAFLLFVKAVMTVVVLRTIVAVGCIMACGNKMRSVEALKGPRGDDEVATPTATSQ